MKGYNKPAPPWVRTAAQTAWPSAGAGALRFLPWAPATPTELQAAKEKITPLEASHRWELTKKMVNPYEIVYTHEDPQFHPSLSLIKPLSRSYFKLMEMLDVLQFFERLPRQLPKVRTAHVAEGPGGFLQAVVDMCERHKKILQVATAMTLKPTDTHVPGWRRASGFLHSHREVKLHYGADGTGDIYQVANQNSFIEEVRPGAHLFTADGGFDFSIDYTIQEQRVFHLLLCSATIGLRALSRDGSMVLKLFDVYAEPTKILILLLGRCFEEWTLYKPCLSRPCNSERYFLARGFRGLGADKLALLLELQRQSLSNAYPYGYAELVTPAEKEYLEEHICANTRDQLGALERAEHFAAHPEDWYANQLPRDFQTSLAWCQAHRIPTSLRAPRPIEAPVKSDHPSECISEPGAVPR